MGQTKEYYLKLSEEFYDEQTDEGKYYLNYLGLQVKQLATEEDLKDERVIAFQKQIRNNYDKLDKYLFEIRNK